jgi:hypothetical protein
MAEKLQLSRNTKVYIRDVDSTLTNATPVWWELPVLDGFAFSQGTESIEITLSEAADSNNNTRRGKLAFNTALAPVEWSLTTYVRPFKSVGGRTASVGGFVDNVAGYVHAVEEPLWAYMVMGAGETYTSNTGSTRAAGNNWGSTTTGVWSNTSLMSIDFAKSNKTALRTFEMYFAMSSTGTGSPDTVYRLVDACVNSVTIDFDIEGIAQLQWAGFAKQITHANSAPFLSGTANSITEAVNSTNTFIRNRLTTANVGTKMTNFGGDGVNNKYYNIILTGGSITIENNITYLTPEELGKVNIPLGHVTGTRSVSGTFTAYLDDDTSANSSGALLRDMAANTSAARNEFAVLFSIGGATAPKVEFNIPTTHLEIPTHNIEDVIGVEVNFMGLPTDISNTNEMSVRYYGVVPA